MSEIDLTSAEVKAAIAEAVAEATEGLKAKNTELLGKIKKLGQGQQIDPSEHQALESERDDLKAKLADANKALNKATKAAEDATKKAIDTETAYYRSLADSALTEELSKAGVTNPVHLKAAKALLAGSVGVVVEGEARVVKAGDKALGDFVKGWAGGDEGKHFVTAANNSGGGAGNGAPTNPTPGDKLPDLNDRAGRAAVLNARLSANQ